MRANPRGAGVSSRTRGAGGILLPANSRTNGRRGTSEAEIESSQREDSYERLKN